MCACVVQSSRNIEYIILMLLYIVWWQIAGYTRRGCNKSQYKFVIIILEGNTCSTKLHSPKDYKILWKGCNNALWLIMYADEVHMGYRVHVIELLLWVKQSHYEHLQIVQVINQVTLLRAVPPAKSMKSSASCITFFALVYGLNQSLLNLCVDAQGYFQFYLRLSFTWLRKQKKQKTMFYLHKQGNPVKKSYRYRNNMHSHSIYAQLTVDFGKVERNL